VQVVLQKIHTSAPIELQNQAAHPANPTADGEYNPMTKSIGLELLLLDFSGL
jgi:hypothetical protein